jgi:hypothetical protein
VLADIGQDDLGQLAGLLDPGIDESVQ